MTITAKIDPIKRELGLVLPEGTPQGRSRAFAAFAREEIDRADALNRRALGTQVPKVVTVDGRKGAPLESVNPDRGRIEAEWSLYQEVFAWIHDRLVMLSPIGPAAGGHYYEQHAFYADRREADPKNPPPARTWTFQNRQPYARRLEVHHGVYETVAFEAGGRFGSQLSIRFVYRAPLRGGADLPERLPTIIVTDNAFA